MWLRLPRGFRWLIGIAVVAFAAYYAYGWGKYVRYAWYKPRIELEVEGEPVIVEGVIGCSRQFLGQLFGFKYDATSTVLLKRFESGAAILIGGIRFCPTVALWDEPDLSPDQLPPIFWIDDLADPKEIEYFATIAFNDNPASRIKLKSFSIDWYERWPAP